MFYLSEAMEEFYIVQAVRGNSKATVRDYRQKLGVFYDFVGKNIPLSDLTLKLCREYYVYLTEKILWKEVFLEIQIKKERPTG